MKNNIIEEKIKNFKNGYFNVNDKVKETKREIDTKDIPSVRKNCNNFSLNEESVVTSK